MKPSDTKQRIAELCLYVAVFQGLLGNPGSTNLQYFLPSLIPCTNVVHQTRAQILSFTAAVGFLFWHDPAFHHHTFSVVNPCSACPYIQTWKLSKMPQILNLADMIYGMYLKFRPFQSSNMLFCDLLVLSNTVLKCVYFQLGGEKILLNPCCHYSVTKHLAVNVTNFTERTAA